MIGELHEDRRAVRRRALRHGDAGAAGVFERTWGIRPPPFWPKATRRVREQRPGFCSWPRSTGTWSGRCSSRASTTPTTSGSTTACATATPGRCASTPRRARLPGQAGAVPREPRRAAGGGDIPARPHTSRGRGHHVPVAGPAVLPPGPIRGAQEADLAAPGPRPERAGRIRRSRQFYDGCSRCCAGRRRDGNGSCSNASRPGTATGPPTLSSPSPGGDRRRAPARGRELRPAPESVLRAAAVRGPRRPAHGDSMIARVRGTIATGETSIARPLPRCAALALSRLRRDAHVGAPQKSKISVSRLASETTPTAFRPARWPAHSPGLKTSLPDGRSIVRRCVWPWSATSGSRVRQAREVERIVHDDDAPPRPVERQRRIGELHAEARGGRVELGALEIVVAEDRRRAARPGAPAPSSVFGCVMSPVCTTRSTAARFNSSTIRATLPR